MAGADLETLVKTIAAEPRAWVRLALTKPVAKWEIRTFEVTLGSPPPGWQALNWDYGTARVNAAVRRGNTVARWLRAGRVVAAGATASCEGLSSTASLERRESRWPAVANEVLEWPSDDWRVMFTDQVNAFQEPVIADDEATPSFPRFELAVANLLGLGGRSGWNVSSRELVVRRQDKTARIKDYEVTSSSLTVTVDGSDLDGSIIELAADLPGPNRRLAGSGPWTEVFQLPDGLPPNAWLLLRRGRTRLDQRMLWRDLVSVSGNSPFSPDEQREIRTRLTEAKALLRTRYADELDEDQLASLEADLDHAADATSWLRRIDWRNIVVGAVVTKAIDGVLDPQTARAVLDLLGHVLPQLLRLGRLALPF